MFKYSKIRTIILSFAIVMGIFILTNKLYSETIIQSNTTNVALVFSKSSVSLTYGGNSDTNTITILGTGCTNVLSSHSTKGIVSGAWSKWSGNAMTYTLTPLTVGTTTITITPIDSSGSSILDSTKSFSVTVSKAKPALSFQNTTLTKTYGDVAFSNLLTKTTDGTVTYNSSDTSVATVEQNTGVVTIIGAGVCTIKASSGVGNNYSDGSVSYSLTVNKASPVLTFNNSAIYKLYGDLSFINPLTKTSDGTITFATSNNKVATVNSRTGVVSIIGSGSCIITVNATAGINYSSGNKSYSLRVAPKDSSSPSMGKSPVATPVSISYTVTFNSNGGSRVNSQVVTVGKTVSIPSSPIKNGFSFEGWFDNEGKRWDFKKVISSNIILTAKWKVKQVTLKAGFSKGKIKGKATPKATIKLIYNKKTIKRTIVDAKGNFSLKNLDKYKWKKFKLQASKKGYQIKDKTFDFRKTVALKFAFEGYSLKGKTTPKAVIKIIYNRTVIRKTRADSKGRFIMKNLKLDQYVGKTLRFQASKKGYKTHVKKSTLKKR